MSKKANPRIIGSFVIGAVALTVIAVLLFGGSEFIAEKDHAVSYFPGSVKGLRVGANVTFRGVRVGYVESMQLIADADTLETAVGVTMQLLPETFALTRDGRPLPAERRSRMGVDKLVEAGLRAKLDTESLVTGLLQVDLDFYPGTPVVYRGTNPAYDEIPTIPTDLDRALASVQSFIADLQENFDIEKAARDVQGILSALDELGNSPDLRDSLAGLNRLVNSADTQNLSSSLQAAIGDMRRMIVEVESLVAGVDAEIEPLMAGVMPAVEQLDQTLAAGEQALTSAVGQIQGNNELIYELTSTLEELQGATRSLRIFLDFIERNPDALLRGKKKQ